MQSERGTWLRMVNEQEGSRRRQGAVLSAAADPLSRSDAAGLGPAELRRMVRGGRWASSTEGLAMGFLQANLVVVPADSAFEFLLFCMRNASACPLIEVGDVGAYAVPNVAADSDLRTDLPRYRVFHGGEVVDEPTDVRGHWRKDAVAFLLGCALTADEALQASGIPVRHLEQGRAGPVYVTTVPCASAGRFEGPLVVNMRPVPAGLVSRAVAVTGRYPLAHGAPVHVGDSEALGIKDLDSVDFGGAPELQSGDVPVFWSCGITPQLALSQARLDYAITHFPGHMYVTDRRAEEDASH